MDLFSCLKSFEMCLSDSNSIDTLTLLFTLLSAVIVSLLFIIRKMRKTKESQKSDSKHQSVETGNIKNSTVNITQKR